MAPTIRPTYRRSLALIAGAALLANVGFAGLVQAQGMPQTNGPTSVADLAEGLLDAVVNISTSQNVKDDEGAGPAPRAPDGSPFQEFFNDFFNKQKGKQGGNHNVSSLGSGFVIDPQGIVVTNNHVIADADDIEVILPMARKLKAKLSAPTRRPISPF
jgi:serine protease Do